MKKVWLLPAFALAGYFFWPLAASWPAVWIALPLLFRLGQLGRLWAWALWTLFYASPLSAFIPAAANLAGASPLTIVPAWIIWCLAVSAPSLILGNGPARGLLAMVCAFSLALPPFGLMSISSPFLAVGMIFPGSGWIGMLLMPVLAGLIAEARAKEDRKWVLVVALGLAAVSLGLNIVEMRRQQQPPTGWEGMDTHYGSVSTADLTDQVRIADFDLPKLVHNKLSDARAQGQTVTHLFLGEGLITAGTEFSPSLWNDALREWNEVSVLVGEYRPLLAGEMVTGLASGVAWRGNETSDVQVWAEATAAVTFPGVMWQPWAGAQSYPLHAPSAPRLLDGHMTHMSWCFESALVWPHLTAAWTGADVMVSLENRWSTRGTVLEDAHSASARVVARWLGAGLLTAVNR